MLSFSDIVRSRASVRVFDRRPVSHEDLREILSLAQWAPYSCNLQLTRCIAVDDPAILSRLAKEADPKFGWAPCVIVLAYDPRIGRERNASEVSLGGIMQTILLSAEDLGLAACPMAGFRGDARIKRILGIPESDRIGLLIALGHPLPGKGGSFKRRIRLPFDQFVSWNGKDVPKSFPTVSMRVSDWKMADIISYRERLAPVYLYPGHSRLQLFSDAVISADADRFCKETGPSGKTVLDLSSYDGACARLVMERKPDTVMVVSDYLSSVGEAHVADFPQAHFASIDSYHRIDVPSGSCDIVSCFHKLEFTPQWPSLIREAMRALRPGGILYISTRQPSLLRRFFDALRIRWSAPGHAPNVYDGNPFYKIGPFGFRRFSRIIEACEVEGLVCAKQGRQRVSGASTLGHRFAWGVFVKSGPSVHPISGTDS